MKVNRFLCNIFVIFAGHLHVVLCMDNKFSILETCENTYYGTTLNTLTSKTALSCLIQCSQDPFCRSVMYTPGTGTCVTNKSIRYYHDTSCQDKKKYGQIVCRDLCHEWRANPMYRLCNGNHDGTCRLDRGRLEVFYDGAWGPICDDQVDETGYASIWYNTNADVACRSLGYRGGYARNQAYYGQGNRPPHLDEVDCYGHEAAVHLCSHNPWGDHDCNNDEDVGVECYD